MVPDCLANKAELSLLLDGADQAEVAGSATDIDDQALGPGPKLRGFGRGVHGQPAVKGGLRLFEEYELFKPGPVGGLDREVAGHVVEGSGHGEHDRLLFQPVLGSIACHGLVPALDHVSKIARRSVNRRDAGHVRWSAPGQERRGTIHARVAEPRLGTGHQPPGDARPVVASEFSHGIVPGRVPGQGHRAGGKVVCPGKVEKGGEQGSAG